MMTKCGVMSDNINIKGSEGLDAGRKVIIDSYRSLSIFGYCPIIKIEECIEPIL